MSSARLCDTAEPETYAVVPFDNKTGVKMELAGAEDLLAATLLESGCFRVIERERLAVLITEMKLCAETNPDSAYFKCASFAKKGQILGVQRMVLPEVMFFEPNVKGAELGVKMPGLSLAGLDFSRSYAAFSLSVRIVDVETAEQTRHAVLHAVVPSEKYGAAIGAGGFDFHATVQNRTPMGEQLHTMMMQAAKELTVRAPVAR
ncbi:MAG: hypothetical protein KF764_20250 [Labilithrix sp.]|nr:hypothetical protein [Labilithrix sp.]